VLFRSISTRTVKRYVKKATRDIGDKAHDIRTKQGGEQSNASRKLNKRVVGVNKAIDRLSPEETFESAKNAKAEKIVKGMKKNKADLKKRYGDDWESVMYATANKMAEGKKSGLAKTCDPNARAMKANPKAFGQAGPQKDKKKEMKKKGPDVDLNESQQPSVVEAYEKLKSMSITGLAGYARRIGLEQEIVRPLVRKDNSEELVDEIMGFMFDDSWEQQLMSAGALFEYEWDETYNVGDKVKVSPKGLQFHAKKTPSALGYSSDAMKWRQTISKIQDEGLVGTVVRVHNDAVSVSFEHPVYGGELTVHLYNYMVEPSKMPTA